MKKLLVLTSMLALLMTLTIGFGVSAALDGNTQGTDFDGGVLDDDLWTIQSIPDETKVTLADDALVFSGAGDGCSFGPAGIYKDFTVYFDVVSVEEGSTFIGFCFGMDEPYDNFWDAGGNMVYFQQANTDAFKDGAALLGTDPAGVGTDNGGGRGWTRPGYELFSVDGPNPEVLNYKVVVKDGTAEVYYKKASDPAEELDVLRVRFAGFGDTTGFVKIASTAGANYTIDNFQILDETELMTTFDGNTIDESSWTINSIPTDDKVTMTDDALVFSGAGDGCYFAADPIFKDFVLTFDVLSVEEGSTFIGACFGMDEQEDNFWDAGGNMIYFQQANTDAFKDGAALLGTDPAGVGTDNGGGRGWTRPGYELFSVDGPNPEVLNYKLVVRNGTAEVYYKKASDPAAELDVLRIRIGGFGDTTGFVKIVSTAGANYTLDNIAIKPYLEAMSPIPALSTEVAPKAATTDFTTGSTDVALNSLKLTWDGDDDASSYRVVVYTLDGETYTEVDTFMTEDVQELTIEGLAQETEYVFQVTSYDSFGLVNNYYEAAAFSTAAPVIDDEEENPQTADAGMLLLAAGALVSLTAIAKRR